jgi:dTDP-4-amino-4,6-dideoxygalactose transaminase
MQELSAVLGISQMQRVDEFVNKRNILADRYYNNLKNLKSLICPNEYVSESQIHSWWHYMIVISKTFNRTELAELLLKNGIPTANAYSPACHEQPIFKEYSIDKYPVADDILNRHLALPLHVEMTLEQVDFVCDSIKKFLVK